MSSSMQDTVSESPSTRPRQADFVSAGRTDTIIQTKCGESVHGGVSKHHRLHNTPRRIPDPRPKVQSQCD